ncbi:segregation/condensation protein A [Thalassobacillus hwangdonensis]|uniref:Segregation and condensation protein A n=1 Tax=Thalassobacillus hwangdonensis TaxID=546108 RepID=A0ABW3KZM0_9BACI
MNKSYQVKVDAFEGPLDLLLHLINRYEIDIYDIPVATITEQYMAYIHTMQVLELDVASEYLVMAATLLAIKSQMLLPKQPVEFEDEDELEEDPREELMRRLIEYRKYKEAAASLKDKEQTANHVYTRQPSTLEEYMEEKPKVTPGEASIYDMLGALSKLFQRKQWEKPAETKVQRDEIPIQTRMEEIMKQIDVNTKGVGFFTLFPEKTRSHIVVTFMAILELMKINRLTCVQNNHFDELIVYKMEDQ